MHCCIWAIQEMNAECKFPSVYFIGPLTAMFCVCDFCSTKHLGLEMSLFLLAFVLFYMC
jgi:hypothetical protein